MMRSTIKMDAAYGVRSRELPGDWRRRKGTKTDAHLYPPRIIGPDEPSGRRPRCWRKIRHVDTEPVRVGRPCGECLVAAITSQSLYSDAVESGGNR